MKIKAFAESALHDPITVNVGRAGAANLDVIQVLLFAPAKIALPLDCLDEDLCLGLCCTRLPCPAPVYPAVCTSLQPVANLLTPWSSDRWDAPEGSLIVPALAASCLVPWTAALEAVICAELNVTLALAHSFPMTGVSPAQ